MCQEQQVVLQRLGCVLPVLSVVGASVKLPCPVHQLPPGAQLPTCLPEIIFYQHLSRCRCNTSITPVQIPTKTPVLIEVELDVV